MRNNKVTRLIRGAATIAVCAIGLSASAGQRPITDFVENQGTYGIIFWIDAAQNTFLVDYAGVVNEAWGMGIPTTFDGSIDEKPLADGTAAVSVILHTHNAYALVQGPDFDSVLFGNVPLDVLSGSAPALGDSTLQVRFINPGGVGAPLPDLVQLLAIPAPGQTLSFLAFTAQATGTLPDGTPALAHVRATGLLGTVLKANRNSKVVRNFGFPSEKIIIQAVGN